MIEHCRAASEPRPVRRLAVVAVLVAVVAVLVAGCASGGPSAAPVGHSVVPPAKVDTATRQCRADGGSPDGAQSPDGTVSEPAPSIGWGCQTSAGTWRLTFDDEFNGTALNRTHWATGWFGSGTTAPGFGDNACYSPNNVSQSGGYLNLAVTAQPCTVKGKTYPYTGALVSTNPSSGATNQPRVGFAQTYGFFEARIYVPASSGSSVANWPTWWTNGQTWPADGEMDLLEGLSGQACWVFHSPGGSPGGCSTSDMTGWHIFGADWQPGIVTFYEDGVPVGRITTGITSAPMYLILDNTVGATGTAATMKVDYVRVWSGS